MFDAYFVLKLDNKEQYIYLHNKFIISNKMSYNESIGFSNEYNKMKDR